MNGQGRGMLVPRVYGRLALARLWLEIHVDTFAARQLNQQISISLMKACQARLLTAFVMRRSKVFTQASCQSDRDAQNLMILLHACRLSPVRKAESEIGVTGTG